MEAVGFAAAVLSIVEAAHAAGKFASIIRQVAKDAGNVGERIKKASWIFTTFEHSIRAAQVLIKYQCPQNTDSPVFQYIERFGVSRSLTSLSDSIILEIMDQRRKILTIPSWLNIYTSYKWTKMKPNIMDLHLQMESLKSTFALFISIIILEHTVAKSKGRRSDEYENDIEFLKKKIEGLIEEIRDLRRDLMREKRLISVSIRTSNASTESLASQLEDQLRAVCHLGQSFVETEAVPTRPPKEFSFRDVKRRQSYRQRHAASTSRSASVRPTVISSASHQPRARPTSISATSPVPVPVPVPGPSFLTIFRGEGSKDTINEEGPTVAHFESVPDNHEEKRREQIRQRPDSEPLNISETSKNSVIHEEDMTDNREVVNVDKSANDEPEISNLYADEPLTPTHDEQQEIDKYSRRKQKQKETSPTIARQAEPTPPQTSTSPTQISPLTTTSSHSYHHPEPSNRRVPSGGGEIFRTPQACYIINKTGRHLFQPYVDPQLLGNLITSEYAKKLGLPIKRHPRETKTYRDTEIESVGRVSLNWSTRSTSTLVEPGSIECTVCETLEYPLIFGPWFVKAQRHMSREEEREVQD